MTLLKINSCQGFIVSLTYFLFDELNTAYIIIYHKITELRISTTTLAPNIFTIMFALRPLSSALLTLL